VICATDKKLKLKKAVKEAVNLTTELIADNVEITLKNLERS
jgi:hypothetical protein